MKRLNSKWSYMVCGLNVGFAIVGAMWHSLVLMLLSAFFAMWNYYTAEYSRRIEENEQVREDTTNTKTEE